MDSKQHIDNVLNTKIREIFEKAATRIDELLPGEKVAATTLAEDIAKGYGMTGPQLYSTLKFLFDGYPGVTVRRGAHGGIIKLVPVPVATDVTTDNQSAADDSAQKE